MPIFYLLKLPLLRRRKYENCSPDRFNQQFITHSLSSSNFWHPKFKPRIINCFFVQIFARKLFSSRKAIYQGQISSSNSRIQQKLWKNISYRTLLWDISSAQRSSSNQISYEKTILERGNPSNNCWLNWVKWCKKSTENPW